MLYIKVKITEAKLKIKGDIGSELGAHIPVCLFIMLPTPNSVLPAELDVQNYLQIAESIAPIYSTCLSGLNPVISLN